MLRFCDVSSLYPFVWFTPSCVLTQTQSTPDRKYDLFRKLIRVLTSCHLAAFDGVGIYYVELVLEQGTSQMAQAVDKEFQFLQIWLEVLFLWTG
ncbi:MAG: hypothetical protein CMM03_05610 [Rhodopirellula sp.]|nr:hypothetical protein [Rhodopirellula sp.]